jgi:glycosyltransferase involved in cell wall biosynthesis
MKGIMIQQNVGVLNDSSIPGADHAIKVALLTGGSDRPYVFGLSTELIAKGAALDLIGSDELDTPEFRNKPGIRFFNLRGDVRSNASSLAKVFRILKYYSRLIGYTATAKPRIFHILWNNKFETFDRTVLMIYYKLFSKRIVLTAHNVNAGKRDSQDTYLNRLTLRIQYRLADHIFVHTEKSKAELIEEFGAHATRVSIIPFGINNSVPNTDLTPTSARQRLGIRNGERAILFFGRITPYKGLEYLLTAFRKLMVKHRGYRLVIAGRPDRCEDYWNRIREDLSEDVQRGRVLLRSEFIPEDETEVYFKAADVLVLPYRHVYQSGVLFLGHSFGLPVVAADVGSLKDDIVEGRTGYVFKPEDPNDLARAVEQYFASDLFADLKVQRQKIRDYARQQHSWEVVGQMTMNIYAKLVRFNVPGGPS